MSIKTVKYTRALERQLLSQDPDAPALWAPAVIEPDRACLILHGFPDGPDSLLPMARALLDEGLDPIIPYLPGYGPNPAPRGSHPLRVARQLWRTLSYMGIAHCSIIGHDWGAAIAYAMSLLEPDRCRALVGISLPPPLLLFSWIARDLRQRRASRYMFFFQLPALPELALRGGLIDALWRRWSPSLHLDAQPRQQLRDTLLLRQQGPRQALDYYRSFGAHLPRQPLLSAHMLALMPRPIAPPSLLITGVQDRCILPSSFRGYARFFQHPTELVTLPGGHFLPTELPGPLAQICADFLASPG